MQIISEFQSFFKDNEYATPQIWAALTKLTKNRRFYTNCRKLVTICRNFFEESSYLAPKLQGKDFFCAMPLQQVAELVEAHQTDNVTVT